MNDSKVLCEIEDIALEMRVEIDSISRLADTLWDELFDELEPSETYRCKYIQLQAVFHMMTEALHKFNGEFSLLTGGGETHYYKCIAQRPDRLRAIDHYLSTPRKVGKAV